jgi:hypothetical protein
VDTKKGVVAGGSSTVQCYVCSGCEVIHNALTRQAEQPLLGLQAAQHALTLPLCPL